VGKTLQFWVFTARCYAKRDDVMAAILKFWRHIKTAATSLNEYFYVRNISAKFHPDPLWNDAALDFKRGLPNNNNNNKLSSDQIRVETIEIGSWSKNVTVLCVRLVGIRGVDGVWNSSSISNAINTAYSEVKLVRLKQVRYQSPAVVKLLCLLSVTTHVLVTEHEQSWRQSRNCMENAVSAR